MLIRLYPYINHFNFKCRSRSDAVKSLRSISQCTDYVLPSMRNDLDIPTQYNLAQFVMKDWPKYGTKIALVCTCISTFLGR